MLNIYEKKLHPMLNFNGNNIGFTKFCQENVKKKLQKYLCPMTFCNNVYQCFGEMV
jgi:hypothetical protein